jgi:membrane-bound serine protease (ClpP class)
MAKEFHAGPSAARLRIAPGAWRLWRVWLYGLAVCAGLFSLAPAAQGAPLPVHLLTVQGAIDPASADYVVRGIERAQQEGAPLVVLRLDTPGGLDGAMRQIIQAILGSAVPVVTYVSPEGARAASAGTYILYASHIAAMAPATTLGAATPVSIGMPGQPAPPPDTAPAASAPASAPMLSDAMKAKQVNDAAAFIRGLAQRHGRNAVWAERAVREAVTLTASEAQRENVIDIVAADLPALLAQIDGRQIVLPSGKVTLATKDLSTLDLPPDARHRLLSVIANPSFALILMMIGIYGLIFEFSSPGFGIPGTVGAICLLLAMFALQMLPVNYAGLALILLGMGLLAAELLSPSFGVFGVGGVVAFVAGALLLFDRDVPGMGVPLTLIFGLAASSAALMLLGGSMALRARRAPVVSGREQLIGSAGVIERSDGDATWAWVQGERWRVVAGADLRAGQAVRVTALDGLTLTVEADSERQTTPGGHA